MTMLLKTNVPHQMNEVADLPGMWLYIFFYYRFFLTIYKKM